jgi:hypothetical protein
VPVSRLLVEGKLDIQVLVPLFAGNPVVDSRHSPKGSLAPRVRDLRHDQKVTACYVRDRDFDFLPEKDLTQPTPDKTDAGAVLGWRWCRHEIENYLIEPELIAAALGWDRAAFEAELLSVAGTIKHYQAARWAAGQARQVLPPAKDFPNRPPECTSEFQLPLDVSDVGTTSWIRDQATAFIASVQTALAQSSIEAAVVTHVAQLTQSLLDGVSKVLVWYSGKDLLAGLHLWLQTTHRLHPTTVLERVRDWVGTNPDQTLQLLPEWDAFRTLLRSYP